MAVAERKGGGRREAGGGRREAGGLVLEIRNHLCVTFFIISRLSWIDLSVSAISRESQQRIL